MNADLLLLNLEVTDTEGAHTGPEVRNLDPDIIECEAVKTVWQARNGLHALYLIKRYYTNLDRERELHLQIVMGDGNERPFELVLAAAGRNEPVTVVTDPRARWLVDIVAKAFFLGCPLVWIIKSRDIELGTTADETFRVVVGSSVRLLAFSHGNVRAFSA